MYNYFMLIGRLVHDIDVKELDDGRKVLSLILACNRPFRKGDGSVETDFLKVTLWETTAEIVAEHVRKGAMLGIKGRLVPHKETLSNGSVVYCNDLVGDRVVFFSNTDTKVEG